MIEFKLDLSGFREAAAELRKLEKKLSDIRTYMVPIRTEVVREIQATLSSGSPSWTPLSDAYAKQVGRRQATLVRTGKSKRELASKSRFKVRKQKDKLVMQAKSILVFHHHGTKTGPVRRVFTESDAIHKRLSKSMEQKAQKIADARLRRIRGKK